MMSCTWIGLHPASPDDSVVVSLLIVRNGQREPTGLAVQGFFRGAEASKDRR